MTLLAELAGQSEEVAGKDRLLVAEAGAVVAGAPLLVTAGERDWRCPPTQAEQLYVSVKKQGVESKLVIYQDEHHNVGDPDRAIHRIEELAAWFDDHDPGTE